MSDKCSAVLPDAVVFSNKTLVLALIQQSSMEVQGNYLHLKRSCKPLEQVRLVITVPQQSCLKKKKESVHVDWSPWDIFVMFWQSVMTQIIFCTGISTFWTNKYLFLNLSYLVLKLYIIAGMPGSTSSRSITFYLIMCMHTYCTFHPKPGHVSAIRKGKNICSAKTVLRQKCLLNSMSHWL